MHSLAIAQSILQAALLEAEKYDAKRIKAIGVKIGDDTFMEPDALQFCLEAMAKGTIAEGAQIEIELVGTTARCPECALVFPVEGHPPIFPRGDDGNPEMLTGREFHLVTLELD